MPTKKSNSPLIRIPRNAVRSSARVANKAAAASVKVAEEVLKALKAAGALVRMGANKKQKR
jgi:hypothetical protein